MFRVVLAFSLTLLGGVSAAEHFDVLFRGGQVFDGIQGAIYRADLAVVGDRVAALGDLAGDDAERVVDCAGLTLAPGFIDIHSHADGPGEGGGIRHPDERRRAAPNLVSQGVTTVVVNQDGRSLTDIGRQRERLDEMGHGPNAVLLVGHNSIRQEAMRADFRRAATDEEVEAMAAMVRDGMEAGAMGLSAGLEYMPGIWSVTGELVSLVREIVPYGGVYIVHERASGSDPMWYLPSQDPPAPPTMVDNIKEQISVAEQTGATTVATHIKARGADYWGKSKEMIALIEDARERGVPIWADQYPYSTSGSDGAIVLVPRWIVDEYDGPDTAEGKYVAALRAALAEPRTAERLSADVDHMVIRRGGPENILIMDYPDETLVGKSLAEVALLWAVSPLDAVFELQYKGFTDRLGGARLRGFSMSEEDIEAFAAQPWVITASDAGIALVGDPLVHARYYGTFPRKIAEYAKKRGVLSIEQALHSMTSLPAQVMGLHNRGVLKTGAYADVAIINLDTIEDKATFFEPHQYAEGIEFVLVNGEFVVDEGELTWALPGRVLTRESAG